MGCFVGGDKNCMGCFVRGGKLMWDVLSGVAKNGMGCFVPGCFVLHSDGLHLGQTKKCVSGNGSENFRSFFLESKYNFMHFERFFAFQNA